ncbi:tail fiber protein [Paenibacillus oceani]|uniref:Tail fiber protein n=1 Tax=Paenibacillus oceani TaxID=2772510 RepID=A0A927C5S8_9BACL|nr:tail fiber protein [Paenibacillus oceani]MBD2860527.1 tail fiber protein [Paenibacillus oceani]
MQLTPNLNLKKPEGTDVVDIADLNENADKLDTEVAKLASTTAPGRMSAADKAKLDAATSAATASMMVQRDASGRFKAAAPAAADDVARKQEITEHADVKATTGGGYGHTTLVDAVNSTATDKAATARAVKEAFDKGANAVQPDAYVPPGSSLNDVIESGFYRLQDPHPDAPPQYGHGQMIVCRGGDTIFQIVKSYNNSAMYVRSGNPSATGGTGSWTPWYAIMTSDGGAFTGYVVHSAGARIGKGAALSGTKSDDSTENMIFLDQNGGGTVITGTPNIPFGVHSSATPTWWDGTVVREFIHSGGGQNIYGSLVVTGAGSIFANSGTFYLGNPASGSTLSGPHTIMNIYSNSLRFYESGGSNRGISLNLAECLPGAGSVMWHSQNSHRVSVQATAPTPLQVGDVWIDTSA